MYPINNQTPTSRKVVVYARVSTEHEAQLSALENQKDWYKPIVSQHPEWEIIRMYVDEGITGTSAKKRPNFMRMIEDADKREFDLILTREVSRFARNTVDTLQYTRDLKAKGVEAFFINDNIRTFDGDGELRLTIMATLAQDESRKTSIRVKSGQQTSMEKGTFYGTGNILGYDRKGKEMVINPDQARTVRMIYDWYLDGVGIRAIKFKLEQARIPTATGNANWHEGTISRILQNSFYCGIIKYHKWFTPDYLEQKKIRNFGDIDYTIIRGSHEPIVTEEEYERVQRLVASRRQNMPNQNYAGRRKPIGKKQSCDVWTDIMICECGHKFNRKVWHKLEDSVQYGYQCYGSICTGTVATRLKKGLPIEGTCRSPMIPGWKLQMMAKEIFRDYLTQTDKVLALAQSMLEKHLGDKADSGANEQQIERLKAESEKLNKRLHNLIEMRADGEISREVFSMKKEEAEKRLMVIQQDLDMLEPKDEEQEDPSYEDKITVLRYFMEQSLRPDNDEDIPEEVIKAFIVRIEVREDGFYWYLRFDPDNPPRHLVVEGKRKNSARVSKLCYTLHRLRSRTADYTRIDNAPGFAGESRGDIIMACCIHGLTTLWDAHSETHLSAISDHVLPSRRAFSSLAC